MARFNKNPLAFDDVKDILNRALDSESGIKITCKNHAEAMSLRIRIHYYRKIDKDLNAVTYPPEHALHSVSIWHRLVCQVPKKGAPDDNVLRITKRTTDHLIIEPIEPEPKEG
jgi:hypothetical protein